MIELSELLAFDWDHGNSRKNDRHAVGAFEAEEVFFNQPLLLLADHRYSEAEPRFHALGATHAGRLLHITFTLRGRGTRVRVISARDMHRKERTIYGQAIDGKAG